jgi:hypothetical protein
VTRLVISRLPWLPAPGAVTLAHAGAQADPGKEPWIGFLSCWGSQTLGASMVKSSLHEVQSHLRHYAST